MATLLLWIKFFKAVISKQKEWKHVPMYLLDFILQSNELEVLISSLDLALCICGLVPKQNILSFISCDFFATIVEFLNESVPSCYVSKCILLGIFIIDEETFHLIKKNADFCWQINL